MPRVWTTPNSWLMFFTSGGAKASATDGQPFRRLQPPVRYTLCSNTALSLSYIFHHSPGSSVHCITLPSLLEIPDPSSPLTFRRPTEANIHRCRHLYLAYTHSRSHSVSLTEKTFFCDSSPPYKVLRSFIPGTAVSQMHSEFRSVQHCIIGVRSHDSPLFSFLRELAHVEPSEKSQVLISSLFLC